MGIYDYFHVVRKRWRIFSLVVLVSLATSFWALSRTPREYEATTSLFVSAKQGATAADLNSTGTFVQARVKSYADIVDTRAVLEPVVRSLQLPGGSSGLASKISAEAPLDTVLLNVAVRAESPNLAARIANAVGLSLSRVAQGLEPPTADGQPPVRITTVQPANPPASAATPNKKLYIGVGLLAGLLFGVSAALARHRLDSRMHSADEIASLTTVPVLGSIGRVKSTREATLMVLDQPKSVQSEAYRQIRTNLQFLGVDSAPRCFCVTSAIPGEGKTTTSANLAATLSETGAKVLLIDADLRRSKTASLFGIPSTPGLAHVLSGGADLGDAVRTLGQNGLDVLVAGFAPPNPSELLGSRRMLDLLGDLRNQYDYIIIDTPPVLPVTDATVLAPAVDGVLLVAGASVVKPSEVQAALAQLDAVKANVVGIVANRVGSAELGAYGYYYANDASELATQTNTADVGERSSR
jgi:polysaccharide biosynthesis transport protein